MSTDNPFASPKSDLGSSSPQITAPREGQHAWRDQDSLVVTHDTELPDRCVKCNSPALGYRVTKSYMWHNPFIYLSLFLGLLIYVILALVLRKTMKIAVGLCPACRKRQRNKYWAGLHILGVGAAGVLGGFYLSGEQGGILSIAGMVLFLVGLIYLAIIMNLLSPKRIDRDYAWFKRVSPLFLDELPNWAGPPGSVPANPPARSR